MQLSQFQAIVDRLAKDYYLIGIDDTPLCEANIAQAYIDDGVPPFEALNEHVLDCCLGRQDRMYEWDGETGQRITQAEQDKVVAELGLHMTSAAVPASPVALRFYHGTHSGNLDAIQTNGLIPQSAPDSAMRGNLSTLPGYTEQCVYLAPTIEEAAFYAKSQAEHAGTDPVVFSVIVKDSTLLCVSDDYVKDQAIETMLVQTGLPQLEYDEEMDVHQYGTSSEAYFAWREVIAAHSFALLSGGAYDPALIEEIDPGLLDTLEDLDYEKCIAVAWEAIGQTMREAMRHDWQRSIATDRDPSVGYRGAIGPENLQGMEPADVLRAIKKIRRGDGSAVRYDLTVSDLESPHALNQKRHKKLR